ncbi:hypothetical protein JCM8097_002759 [Rhodosporidiobolus ruineniae]
MSTSTASTPSSPPPPTILDLRNRSPSSPPASPPHSPVDAASNPASSPSTIATSVSDDVDPKPLVDPLRQQIVDGLLGSKAPIVPGKDSIDRQYSFRRTVPTMTLYSERGLEIYEQITRTKAYYPFNAEKELLQQHGDEIACRMFGLPSALLVGAGEKEKKSYDHHASNGDKVKEKWGDPSVGLHNYGVNGGLNHRQPLHSSVGLAVELGSGSLDKTRVLLRSMAKLLQPQNEGDEYGPMKSLDYKALDLEAESLRSTLSTLASVEGDCVTTELQDSPASPQLGGKRRVSVSGLHATYDEGLAFLKAQAAAEAAGGRADSSPFSSPSSSPERLPAVDEEHESLSLAPVDGKQQQPLPSQKRATSILWLGSSIGNFTRSEAVQFLKGIELAEGDTMLIGVDGCADGPKIEEAYNDPEGVTRAFILEGVNVAGRTLGGEAEEVVKQENFEYVNRWNATLGRHEAYIRAKKDLVIPLPDTAEKAVKLEEGELLQIEVSYKYTFAEALALFHLSGLRLIQHWTDPSPSSSGHALYLVERPRMWFPSPWKSAAKMLGIQDEDEEKREENVYGVPTLEEWEEMWRAWDGLMLDIFPPSLRFTKPIPLRHVPLFYVGHIPAFRDIHLSRVLNEPFTEPANFTQIFERGIDPDLDDGECKHWHSEVPQTEADWPAMDEIVEYERKVRERVRDMYRRFDGKWSRRMARVLMMVFEHEQMHWETAVYIALQASSSLNLPPGTAIPDFPSLSRAAKRTLAAETGPSVLSFDAQTVTIGHDDNDRDDDSTPYDPAHELGWDCENPRREAKVEAFKISAKPVTNGEYLDWLVQQRDDVEKLTPSSWAVGAEVKESELAVKTLFGEVEMQYAREWPVAASAEQLEQFAQSKNARLPTFEEMAVFHQHHPVETPLANLGFANLHPVPPTLPVPARDGSTLPATNGGLWQWTSSVLDKWEGFVGSEVYPGYSTDFHDGKHRIVVGGSYATPRRCARPTFVNYYQFNYPFMLGGARIVYDA